MENQRRPIAVRVKGLRDASDLTVDEVAAKTGVPVETYIRYETGEQDVPLSYVSALAACYKVDVTALLTGGDAHAKVFHVTRKGTGPVVERSHVYHYEGLGALFAGKVMDPYVVTVEPTLRELHLNSHPGQEFNYVLAGLLRLTVGDNTLVLTPGDSVYFDSATPHGMQAEGAAPATFLAVITA